MSSWPEGLLATGMANQEQRRRNAIRKLEAEGKIEPGMLDKEETTIDSKRSRLDEKAEKERKESKSYRQVGKNAHEEMVVYEAPSTYASEDNGETFDKNAETGTGIKGAMRRVGNRLSSK
jgi:hypothetical protein